MSRTAPNPSATAAGAPSASTAHSTSSANNVVEGSWAAISRANLRMRTWCRGNPFSSVVLGCAFVGSIVWYEVNVTHRNRVHSLASTSEFEMDTGEGNARARAKRVKAQRMLSPQEIAEYNKKQLEQEQIKAQQGGRATTLASSSAASSSPAPLPEAKEEKRVSSTMFVTQGHLQERSGTWEVRSNERNWSIMAQDQFKQGDDYQYRLERSRDDDFGRQAAKRRV